MYENSSAPKTTDGSVSRRAFLRTTGGLTMALAAAGLFGCGQANGADATSAAASSVSNESSKKGATGSGGQGKAGSSPTGKTQAGRSSQGKGASDTYPRVMVVYFSATGHTEAVAQNAAKQLEVEPFTIVPAVPYTDDDLNYSDSSSRVNTEHDDPTRHVELADMQPDGFDEAFAAAKVVLLGYPIWWGGASWVLDDFVRDNDFTGKVVCPFCTSASSPLGTSADDLAKLAGTGEWQEGIRFDIGADEQSVAEWLAGIDSLDGLMK